MVTIHPAAVVALAQAGAADQPLIERGWAVGRAEQRVGRGSVGGPTTNPLNDPQHGNQVRGSDAVAFVLCSLPGKTKLRGL